MITFFVIDKMINFKKIIKLFTFTMYKDYVILLNPYYLHVDKRGQGHYHYHCKMHHAHGRHQTIEKLTFFSPFYPNFKKKNSIL